jgi:hypothetical protein
MKNKHLSGLILAVIFCFIAIVGSSQTDITKYRLSAPDSFTHKKFSELSSYFLNKEMGFKRDTKVLYQLYSVSGRTIYGGKKGFRGFRIMDEFLLPQMTNMFSLSYNFIQHGDANNDSPWSVWLGPKIGSGLKNNNTDLIQNIYGGELEAEYKIHKISFFGAFGFSGSTLKDYNNALYGTSTPPQFLTNSSMLIDIGLGTRFHFEFPESNSSLGIHIKGGLNFWNNLPDQQFATGTNVFDEEKAYIGAGISITTLKPLGKAVPLKMVSPESEVFYSPLFGFFGSKFSVPFQLLNGLSVALTGNVGIGQYGTHLNFFRVPNTEFSHIGGFGADLRFFDVSLSSFVNPYVGFSYNLIAYKNKPSTSSFHFPKSVNYLRIGNKIVIGQSNWYVDVNAAVALFQQKTNTVSALSSTTQPDFNIGVGYKFSIRKEEKIENFRSVYKVYDEYGSEELKALKDTSNLIKKLPPAQMQPVDMDTIKSNRVPETLVEERIYVRKAIGGTITPPPAMPNIDMTDIKFFRISFKYALEMNMFAPDLFDEIAPPTESNELIVAMFDKNRCDVSKLKETNLFLHFADLDSSRYYGYRFDENRQLQPEMRDLPAIQRDSKAGPVYYGQNEDMVKQLKWLDENDFTLQGMTFLGNQIQTGAFRQIAFGKSTYQKNQVSGPTPEKIEINPSNYRLAFAVYPRNTLSEIESVNKNFGVCIMFRQDLNKNYDAKNPVTGHYKDGLIDKADAAFFSNIVHGKNIYDPAKDGCRTIIRLTNFNLGSAQLVPSLHSAQLRRAAELAKLCQVSIFLGFTDSVEFNNEGESMAKFAGDFSGMDFQNNLIKIEFDKIVADYRKLGAGATKTEKDNLNQRALAFRRIVTVVNELKNRYFVDPASISVVPVGILGSKERIDPLARRVEIQFTSR